MIIHNLNHSFIYLINNIGFVLFKSYLEKRHYCKSWINYVWLWIIFTNLVFRGRNNGTRVSRCTTLSGRCIWNPICSFWRIRVKFQFRIKMMVWLFVQSQIINLSIRFFFLKNTKMYVQKITFFRRSRFVHVFNVLAFFISIIN